jgi:hypothetical protein
MPSHGATPDVCAPLLDAGEPGDAPEVDEMAGINEAQLHQWDERLPARKQTCVVAVTLEEHQRVFKGTRR